MSGSVRSLAPRISHRHEGRDARARWALLVALSGAGGLVTAGCAGGPTGSNRPGEDDNPSGGGRGGAPGTSQGGNGPSATGGGSGSGPGAPAAPGGSCVPMLPGRVSRLSDRHLANAVKELLNLAKSPEIRTSASATEEFLPAKPAAVSGAVASKLADVVEAAAAEATATGKPAVQCAGAEPDCARAFIDRFASRAFRRSLQTDDRDKLMLVYTSGRENYGGHAGGIRLVIEAVLQAPSFLYVNEMGAPTTGGKRRLTPHELATKVSLFLRDGLPDDDLWKAAESGKLATEAGLNAEVDRLLARPEVKENVTRMFMRLFHIDRVHGITKAPTIKEFTPALATSMHESTRLFFEDFLWKGGGKLRDLLTSKKAFVDKNLAAIYQVPAPGGTGFEAVTMPADKRAGVLTQASVMTIEATPENSSVVHRGVFIARELLCFRPPPPLADDLAAGELLKQQDPTERGQAEKRMMVGRCAACHTYFDPLGVSFENYDTLGRHRTTLKTPTGTVPVDASWQFDIVDIKGRVNNAIELADRLAASQAVRECVTRQFASYALGQYLEDESTCTLGDVNKKFEASGGDFVQLLRAVATWPALRDRTEGEMP